MCTVNSITEAKISHLRNYKYEANPSIGVDNGQVTVTFAVTQRLKVNTTHETLIQHFKQLLSILM